MKNKWFFGIFFFTLLIALLFAGINSYLKTYSNAGQIDVFVGVDVAYDGVEDIKMLVDEVKAYTNFFVIGSIGIPWNVTKLNEVCQYINDSGLYFATYIHPDPMDQSYQIQWISDARQRWGDRFVGLYAVDEPGGHQIDRYEYDNETYMLVKEANNYTDAADKYIKKLSEASSYFRSDWHIGDFPLLTSDYALYEFDYRADYDLVLAEFGWNHSRSLNVALCRGAAAVQNKKWGVMITWKYDTSPYIEAGAELYNDMVTAYQNGAEYIVVFNYPKNFTYGIFQEEHLEALRQFWQYVKDNPRTTNAVEDKVAYVLPKDYGYGFRGPNDKIWGLWEPDMLSSKIWYDANSLLSQYEAKMDIIYEDTIEQNKTLVYQRLIFWNGTILTRDNNG